MWLNLERKNISWTVYILECADLTLYTGITNNMESRLATHNNGTGAKYTRGRAPVTIVYNEQVTSQSQALWDTGINCPATL